jgi:uncharacterized protein (TIGR02145 family)
MGKSLTAQNYFEEDFSTGQMPPTGWTINAVNAQWTIQTTNNAGGNSPEARFQWIQQEGTTLLISPIIDLSEQTSVNFSFKHFYDDYDGEGPAVGVATHSGDDLWQIVWQIDPTGNVGPEIINLEITNNDVGKTDFQIALYITGNLFNLDFWYIDDLKLYQPVQLDITLMLEGPYNNGQMITHLNELGFIPLAQPYSIAPWNYTGTESVPFIPNENITDWILIELISPVNYPLKPLYTVEARQAAFILEDGSIKDLDGSSLPEFTIEADDSLYIGLHHRNHLFVMSSDIITTENGSFVWDFTLADTMAINGKQSMKELIPNEWGVHSGDADANAEINNLDKNDSWQMQRNNNGYLAADFNLDGIVDEIDLENSWDINAGKGSWIPDTSKIPFDCGDLFIDIRDGHEYSSVQIGEQCWMEENLNYATGTSWCYYNSEAYCNVFGRLYNWETIMNGAPGSSNVPSGVQGICPEGWHLPSDGEWCILSQFVDSTMDCNATGYNGTDGGLKMKSTWGWASGGNGTNESGFNGVPGGSMGIYHFDDLYLFAYFWSTTEDDPGYAWLIKLNYGLPKAGRYFSQKNRGYSVRCLKNE